MNTLIAVQGIADIGKSSVCRYFASHLLARYGLDEIEVLESFPTPDWTIGKELRLVVKIKSNSKVIVIESIGDPNSRLAERLNELITKYSPNIIICTCRTSGETANAVASITQYDKIYTTPYRYWEKNEQQVPTQAKLNNFKAKEIFNLLSELGRLE